MTVKLTADAHEEFGHDEALIRAIQYFGSRTMIVSSREGAEDDRRFAICTMDKSPNSLSSDDFLTRDELLGVYERFYKRAYAEQLRMIEEEVAAALAARMGSAAA